MRILGLDPGLRHTGWGMIEVDGNRLRYVADGASIPTDTPTSPSALVQLHDGLVAVIRTLHAGRGGGRGDLRQPEPDLDPEARLCPRRGAAGAGAGRPAGRRIRRQPRQEIGGRHRPCRQGAGRRRWCAAAAGRRASTTPTRPTRWRSRSATPITADRGQHAPACAAAGARDDRQADAASVDSAGGRRRRHRRAAASAIWCSARRRTLGAARRPRERGGAADRDPGARGRTSISTASPTRPSATGSAC